MRKSSIIILLIILAVAFATALFFYLGREREGSPSLDLKDIPDTPINKICLKISLPDDLYYCLAVANQDMSFCEYLDLPNQRKLCQGMAARDISYCREIQEPGPKKMCYYELSFATGNFNYCDEADDPNDCYFAFIHRLHWESRANEIKAEYCEKLSDDTPGGLVLKNCCLAFRAQDPSLCEGNKYCLSYFKQPLSFCDAEFQTPGGLFKYKDDCLMDRAMSEKDPSICAKIGDDEVRDICYGNISTHISPDLSLCEKVSNEMRRNMCYTEVAINLAQKEVPDKESTTKQKEPEDIIPAFYHIKNPPYYREDGFCWGASAMMLMMYEGFLESEIQEFRNILKNGRGGPPDMFLGFEEFNVLDRIRIAYSKDYNKEAAVFYNRQLLADPEEQVIILANENDALRKLKELISSDVLVVIIGHHGNHYMVVTGYDEGYIYINDPGIDNVYLTKYGEKYQEKIKMSIDRFFEQWTVSGFEGGERGISFPGDFGMIWLEK